MKFTNERTSLDLDVLDYAYASSGWLKVRVSVTSSPAGSFENVDSSIEYSAFDDAIEVVSAVLVSTSSRYRRRLRFTEPCLSARVRKRGRNFVIRIELRDELAPAPRREAWRSDFVLSRIELVELVSTLERCRATWMRDPPRCA